MHDFRQDARNAIKRAKVELSVGDPLRLGYVALELRLALEALTYDRAQQYKSELPDSVYETWQPTKLIRELQKVDPHASVSVRLEVAKEPSADGTDEEFVELGSERILSMSEIQNHYHALGNYLHTPTLKQINSKPRDPQKLRIRCEEILSIIEECLASKMFHTKVSFYLTGFDCLVCSERLVRRLMPSKEGENKLQPIDVDCECGAKYRVGSEDSKWFCWEPQKMLVPCPNPGCETQNQVWEFQAKPPFSWTCCGCREKYVVCHGNVREVDFIAAQKEQAEN